MSFYHNECGNTISKVRCLLQQNPEWIDRYAGYADAIKSNLAKIKNIKEKFHEWAPLYLYMNVTEAKGKMQFHLRYLGQDVAKLKVDNNQVTISTKDFDIKNKRDFECAVELNNSDWKSKKASEFRHHFSSSNKRTDISGKKNDEHRIESLLLNEFSKKSSKNKKLCHIQPVKFGGIARFQMPTPLSASNMNKLKYSGISGGGIDIISRVGTSGASAKLCIMEVKDENTSKEPPAKVIQQAVAYGTFIRELLRSESGSEWWAIFGFNGKKLPAKLKLYVSCAMPSNEQNDKSFANSIINVCNDSFHLHYLFFEEKNNNILKIDSSLNKVASKDD